MSVENSVMVTVWRELDRWFAFRFTRSGRYKKGKV